MEEEEKFLVSLLNLGEPPGGTFDVIMVLIRMMNKGQFPEGLFNLLSCGVGFDL